MNEQVLLEIIPKLLESLNIIQKRVFAMDKQLMAVTEVIYNMNISSEAKEKLVQHIDELAGDDEE